MLRRVAATTTVMIYCQIILGATMRHNDAGLAIPDFPLRVRASRCRRRGTPESRFTLRTASALLSSTSAILATAGHVLLSPSQPAASWCGRRLLLVLFVVMQITLGAFVIWSGLQPVINTAHVVNGALVLTTSLVLTLRSFRAGFRSCGARRLHAAVRRNRRPALAPARRSREARAVRSSVSAVSPRRRAAATSSRWRSRGSTCSSSSLRLPATSWPAATRTMSCASAGTAARTGARRRRGVRVQPGTGARARRVDAAHAPASDARRPAQPLRRRWLFGAALTLAGLRDPRRRRQPARARSSRSRRCVSYAAVYTPLKRRSSFATVVGAIPGALPPVIGWAAARDELSQGAWVLFGIMFLWQLPHFLAIAWMYREDYARAGFPMLPVIEPDGRSTGRQAVVYCRGAAAAQPGADADRDGGRDLLRRRAGAGPRLPRRCRSGSRVTPQRPRRTPAVLRLDHLPAAALDADDWGQRLGSRTSRSSRSRSRQSYPAPIQHSTFI